MTLTDRDYLDPKPETPAEKAWRESLARPSFRKALDEGLADLAAGRTERWETVRARLDPDPLAVPDDERVPVHEPPKDFGQQIAAGGGGCWLTLAALLVAAWWAA